VVLSLTILQEQMNKDKIWEDFVEESKKLIAEDETKIFDAIMDAGAAARIQGVEFTYRKYIKEEQMERFNERLAFRTFLLKRHTK
jgi:archaellum biogenesis protein FlaJ (TadC family)